MRKSFLLKTFVLIVALAVALTVIIITMSLRKDGHSFTAAGSVISAQPVLSKAEGPGTHTFFEQFVVSGGPIVWFVFLPMSLITVYLVSEYWFTICGRRLLPSGTGRRIVEIIRQFGLRQLAARIADRNDFVSIAVVRAIDNGRGDWFRIRNALFESLQEQGSVLLRRIEWVNLIGNVSPMVGLFGTVFGMIKLFNAIVIAGGQPQPAQLADGISVALVTTFWGLLIAIPALAIHGVFRNRIEVILSAAVIEAETILPEIRRSLKKQAEQEKRKQHPIKPEISELPAKPTSGIGERVSL